MGSLLGNEWQGRRHLRSTDCRSKTQERLARFLNGTSAGGKTFREEGRHTGPMMVACQ
jgi:hypothetical protein